MSSSDTLTLIRGDDYQIPVTITNADGTAYNLTGATVRFTVKPTLQLDTDSDASAVIAKTIISHTDASAGETEIVLSNTDTNITPWNYTYDLQITTVAGKVHSSYSGKVTVLADVTRTKTLSS